MVLGVKGWLAGNWTPCYWWCMPWQPLMLYTLLTMCCIRNSYRFLTDSSLISGAMPLLFRIWIENNHVSWNLTKHRQYTGGSGIKLANERSHIKNSIQFLKYKYLPKIGCDCKWYTHRGYMELNSIISVFGCFLSTTSNNNIPIASIYFNDYIFKGSYINLKLKV